MTATAMMLGVPGAFADVRFLGGEDISDHPPKIAQLWQLQKTNMNKTLFKKVG